jgi:pimeloyl-ACP methyl ester carboxylesterase
MLYYVFKYGKIQIKLYPCTYSVDKLKKIIMPTLLIIGDKELVSNPLKTFKRAGKAIPVLTTLLLPDCGHAIPTDQPELAANAMVIFLQ